MTNLGSGASRYWDAVAGMEEFGLTVKSLIKELLRVDGVVVHTIDHRVKTEASAKKKIDAPDSTYESFSSLHDLLGLRITCYFSDDVEKVAKMIEREFHVDPVMSIDKGKNLGTKEFGYRSVHRVARMDGERAQLAEYGRFRSLRFEVQIRSVLQHAWAEIEHDLGYKQESIPAPLSRRFSRLAGVLELVDDEFIGLRNELLNYERAAEEAAKSQITEMTLDKATLVSLIRHDVDLARLDSEVASALGRKLTDSQPNDATLLRRVSDLRDVGVTSINELREAISAWRQHIVAFVPGWIQQSPSIKTRQQDNEAARNDSAKRPNLGVSLYYLWLVMHIEASSDALETSQFVKDPEAALRIWSETVASVGQPPALPKNLQADVAGLPSDKTKEILQI